MRAARNKVSKAVERALRCLPDIHVYFDSESMVLTDHAGLSQFISRLQQAKCTEEEVELEKVEDEHQRLAKGQALQRRKQTWALPVKRLDLAQIVDHTGIPFRTDAEAAEELRRHWQSTMQGSQADTSRWIFVQALRAAGPGGHGLGDFRK